MDSITSKGLVPRVNKNPAAKIAAGLQEIELLKKKMLIVSRRADESTGRRKALLVSKLETLQEELDSVS